MLEERSPVLVVCLGNPGKRYECTRHNMGFLVGQALAKELGVSVQHKKELLGDVAEGSVDGVKVRILFPTTYMNLSGQALRKCIDFFKLPLPQCMVVCDDVALPFGKLRLRDLGSSGGHNGLKSIEEAIGSQHYNRLRVGVGRDEEIELAEFVLGQFTPQEYDLLAGVIQQAKEVLLAWIQGGYTKAVASLIQPKGAEKKIIKDENLEKL